jgi:asparagine synthase (glutamine-hydrolysing)
MKCSVEQGIALLDKLIWHLETYDIISVRASVPMYFLSKAITESGIKVVLSGEGADEILEVICILEMRLPQRNFKRNN